MCFGKETIFYFSVASKAQLKLGTQFLSHSIKSFTQKKSGLFGELPYFILHGDKPGHRKADIQPIKSKILLFKYLLAMVETQL